MLSSTCTVAMKPPSGELCSVMPPTPVVARGWMKVGVWAATCPVMKQSRRARTMWFMLVGVDASLTMFNGPKVRHLTVKA